MKKAFLLIGLLLASMQVTELSASAAGKSKSRSHHYNTGLVPPPPPVPVSPLILASYGNNYSGGFTSMGRFVPILRKQKSTMAEEMRLTAVVDDVAFFKVASSEETLHLKKGSIYQNVTVAQIDPEQVVLEERGKQIVKRL